MENEELVTALLYAVCVIITSMFIIDMFLIFAK